MASPTDRTYFPPLEDCLRGKTAIMCASLFLLLFLVPNLDLC